MNQITVETLINAPVEKVWGCYTQPEHITKWNAASSDWYSPRATNDLRTGGSFNYRMEARDGSEGFDFTGMYDDVIPHKLISYTMDDGRKASVTFTSDGGGIRVTTMFDPENQNPIEMQRGGWQAILDNFKSYVEGQ